MAAQKGKVHRKPDLGEGTRCDFTEIGVQFRPPLLLGCFLTVVLGMLSDLSGWFHCVEGDNGRERRRTQKRAINDKPPWLSSTLPVPPPHVIRLSRWDVVPVHSCSHLP